VSVRQERHAKKLVVCDRVIAFFSRASHESLVRVGRAAVDAMTP